MKLVLLFILLSFNATAQLSMFFSQNKPSGHAPTSIAFVSSQDGGNNGGGTNQLTYSFTVSGGTDRFLLVGIIGDVVAGANDISSVTYNGDALTHIATTSNGGSGRFKYLYYMLNPDAGSNNVLITAGSTHYLISGASEYTGVQGIDNSGNNVSGGAAASLTSSITPVANNCWMIIMEDGYNSNPPPDAGTGATRRSYEGVFGTWGLFDNNGAISPATSTSMTTTRTTAAGAISHILLTIKPW